MKYFIILLFFFTSCIPNKDNKINLISDKDIFDMSFDEYKKMLINYNNNKKYPSVEN